MLITTTVRHLAMMGMMTTSLLYVWFRIVRHSIARVVRPNTMVLSRIISVHRHSIDTYPRLLCLLLGIDLSRRMM